MGAGPRVARLERAFVAYLGTDRMAVPLNSCTAGLFLSLKACELEPGDEVIVPALTFCATVSAVLHAGGTPVLVDVEAATMNIDLAAAERAITPRTRAILPVHFAGRPVEIAALVALARKHGLVVVEDAAHAVETLVDGQHAGTFGDFGCFSFYVTKSMTTAEGGMVVCRDPIAGDRVRRLALHGMSADAWKRYSDAGFRHYDVVEPGFKMNLTDLQASLGIHQLARVEQSWPRRAAIWRRYDEAFAALPVTRPAPVAPGTRHALHLYTLLLDERVAGVGRDEFVTRMTAHNIGVGVHYRAISDQTFFRDRYGDRSADVPHATRIGRQTVSLPLTASLQDGDVDDVIEAVRRSIPS
ncbi:MAG TPA: DegT/DnrJ/EryC1/StrS family aminotransferase, partial [Mycobacteriales bacterium]|nr:DegT/DnrJ/EryC1/StrS family aminotransferase [Mycobacteriales bacterium]